MFGFFPEEGVGDCALAGAMTVHIRARLSVLTMSFVFMMVGARLVEVVSSTL